MKRLPDWRARLSAYLDRVKHRPFDEVAFNCGLFPAGAVAAMTGIDFAADYRGYKTMAGQLRRLRREGFADHAALAGTVFETIHPSRARLGDLAAFAVDDPLGVALGIVNGERSFVLRPDGLGTIATLTAQRAFKVP
ncbi:MAG: hypothetical protein ABJG86_09690 [Nitratireductor sp.]